MTAEQLLKACEQHKYLLLRTYTGRIQAINTKVAAYAKRRFYEPERELEWMSFLPCDFQTYISHKIPFQT